MSKTKVSVIQWTGENLDEVETFILFCFARVCVSDGMLRLITLGGLYSANEGDWIVRGNHRVVVFEKQMFETAYKPVA